MANNDKFLDLGYQKGRSKARSDKGKSTSREPSSRSDSSDLIRLTGLWETKSGNGLIGLVSPSCRLLILENKNREKPSDPPFIAFWAHGSREGRNDNGDHS